MVIIVFKSLRTPAPSLINGVNRVPAMANSGFRPPVAVDWSDNVFVTDYVNDRIQKFTNTGKFIRKWGSHGSGNGQFDTPIGIAINPNGYVFVADYLNDRIQKFTNTGTLIQNGVH